MITVFVPRLVAGIIRIPRLRQIEVFRLAVVAKELLPVLCDVRALELVDVNRIERLPHYVRRGLAPYEIPQKWMHLIGRMHDVLEIIVRIIAETPSAVRKEHLLLPDVRRFVEIIKLAKPLINSVRQWVYTISILSKPGDKLRRGWNYLARIFIVCYAMRVIYLFVDVITQSLVHQQGHLLNIPDIRLERLRQHIFLCKLFRDVLIRRERLAILLPHLRYAAEDCLLVIKVLIYAVRAKPVQCGEGHAVVRRELRQIRALLLVFAY